MKYKLVAVTTLATMAALAAMCAPSFAADDEDAAKVSVGGRFNIGGVAEMVENGGARSNGRVWVFQKTSRLSVAAQQGDTKFYSQLALGAEDVYTGNVNLTLLDMYAQGPLVGGVNWRIGQFRNPYGRELMTDGSALAFNARSINEGFFRMGRDVGAMLQGSAGPVNLEGGIMVGGGRDVPERYIPEILGIPQLTFRATIGDADTDSFTYSQHDQLDTNEVRQSLGLSALFTRDTKVGHGLVLTNKHAVDKNVLINPNYNPYISQKDPEGHAIQGELWQGGLDYVVRAPFGGGTASGEAEALASGFHNVKGDLSLIGGRAQATWNMNPIEVGLRYAIIQPDKNFAYYNATTKTTTKVWPDAKPIQEITPAISYFVNGDKLKLTVDMPFTFNTPTAIESGLGTYNLINQPDQVSYISGTNPLSNQFVYQLRGSIQYAF